ncbi:hypothetical protein ACVWXO_008619 [Bradyrhizobium sp. LM2.7]
MIFSNLKPRRRLLGCEQAAVVVGGNGQERAPENKLLCFTSPAEADARVILYTVASEQMRHKPILQPICNISLLALEKADGPRQLALERAAAAWSARY